MLTGYSSTWYMASDWQLHGRFQAFCWATMTTLYYGHYQWLVQGPNGVIHKVYQSAAHSVFLTTVPCNSVVFECCLQYRHVLGEVDLRVKTDIGYILKADSPPSEVGHNHICHRDHFLHGLVLLEPACPPMPGSDINLALDKNNQKRWCCFLDHLIERISGENVWRSSTQSSPMARSSGSTDRNRPGASGPHGDDTMAPIVFGTPCASIGNIVHSALYIVHYNWVCATNSSWIAICPVRRL